MHGKVKGLLISEVAGRSGVTAKTLRYYEEVGLVDPPARSAAGYRSYDDNVLDRIRFIRSAQALGLSLGEIRSIVALRDRGETPCGRVLELLRDRSAEIDRTIRELRSLKADLNQLVDRAQHLDPAACDPRGVCHLIATTT